MRVHDIGCVGENIFMLYENCQKDNYFETKS